MKLSVVIPCYNEKYTITNSIQNVLKQPFNIELIVVDDKSSDGTREVLQELESKNKNFKLVLKTSNEGKGSALIRGFEVATGDIVLIQDADLEYDPSDYAILLPPLIANKADVVYGSRFLNAPHRVLRFWHWQYPANKIVTLLCNMVSNIRLTDMETCYKVFRRDIIQNIELKENGFGIEPEITIKLARVPDIRFYEVPISYHGRSKKEGKKIRFKDVFEAIYLIFKYGLFGKTKES